MKTMRFDIPKGYEPLDIKEMSEGDEYYLEVDLIEKDKQCNIRYPHSGIDCPCNKV